MHAGTIHHLQRLADSAQNASNDIDRANALLYRSWALLRANADDRGINDFNQLQNLASSKDDAHIQALALYRVT